MNPAPTFTCITISLWIDTSNAENKIRIVVFMINKFLVLALLFLVGCNGIELQLNSSEASGTVNGL